MYYECIMHITHTTLCGSMKKKLIIKNYIIIIVICTRQRTLKNS